ncbi:MAG: hypothetical protein QOJ03_2100 [Frankiaceae bacterium]|nr:hypothetical protein [Frankiaceae bacterium]
MTTTATSQLTPAAPTGAAPAGDPRWVRPALVGLLLTTGVLYLWGLGASGWANGFYSAAVQAGSHSWKAFFFGSFDSASFITVDKPPAALWVMDLSARMFGVNAWSILVPQALMGVGSVALVYATVRRRFTPTAGLIAGAVLATTPAAALMFRFNNPDALLTLLLTASCYAMVRALEHARTRWLVFAGTLIGFAFLTKMLQALVVVPGFAMVYLAAAPTSVGRRVRQLLVAGAAIVVSAGWWVLAVALTPAADRPYVGGSQHNSIWELIVGYNGLGRLTGNETGSVGGAGNAGSQWGPTGIARLFNSEYGGQVAWLIPAALVFLVAILWLVRRAPRTDGRRAQLLLWGSWLIVTGLTLSFAKGIIHAYYVIVLAPAIGALVGIGADATWRSRRHLAPRAVIGGALVITTLWSWTLLDRTPSWHPALRLVVLASGLGAAAAVFAVPALHRRAATLVAGVAIASALAGPAAYALDTVSVPHSGAIPTAGPAGQGGFGRAGFGRGGSRFGPPQAAPNGLAGTAGGPPGRGGLGGLLDTATPSDALVAALRADASSYTWVAATVGSNNAAGVQLATGLPVMSIGGFNGTDPTPTLAEFQALVAAGKVHYFLGGGGGGGGGGGFGAGPGGGLRGSGTSTAITAWVQETFTATTIGGTTVYALDG